MREQSFLFLLIALYYFVSFLFHSFNSLVSGFLFKSLSHSLESFFTSVSHAFFRSGWTPSILFLMTDINVSYPNSITKRGRVGKQVSQTILTSPNIATVVKTPKPICLNNLPKQPSIQDRIYDIEGIATAVTASQFRPKIAERKMSNPYNKKEIKDITPKQTTSCGNVISSAAVLISEDGKNYMRIRKLTPLECWRLMGFDDKDFEKAKNIPTSDTQLYKQAGNSIVVNVREGIFKELLKIE